VWPTPKRRREADVGYLRPRGAGQGGNDGGEGDDRADIGVGVLCGGEVRGRFRCQICVAEVRGREEGDDAWTDIFFTWLTDVTNGTSKSLKSPLGKDRFNLYITDGLISLVLRRSFQSTGYCKTSLFLSIAIHL
jgi:hypothetical protein